MFIDYKALSHNDFMKKPSRKFLRCATIVDGLLWLGLVCFWSVYIVGVHAINNDQATLISSEHLCYDKNLGFKPRSNHQFTHFDITQVAADTAVIYSIVNHGARNTGTINSPRTNHVLMLGGSYTFGQGLRDSLTFPFLLQNRSSRFSVSNFGFMGYSPQQIHQLVEHKDWEKILPSDSGVIFYNYINHHVDRLRGDPFSWTWLHHAPEFVLDENLLIKNKGSFYSNHPLSMALSRGLTEMGWHRLAYILYSFGANSRASLDANKVLAYVLLDIKMAFRRQVPNYSFYLVFMPGECNAALKDLCEELGVETIDFCQAIDLDSIGGRQVDGYHPNDKGSEALSALYFEMLTNGSL